MVQGKEQEIKGRDLILQKITETTENTAIAFTDGSCLNNPGPCGAGAIVFVEEETTEPFFCILFILSKISSVILLWFSIFQCRVSIPIAV
jgi:hypothetical protein